jgi:LacI family transcriptional regulator, galactose operon repressor
MVTIKDIAREVGVSHPTVSLVLNNKAKQSRISDKLSQKIFNSAKKLGYVRNEIARSMVTGKNEVIAFISAEMGDSAYTGKIQEGVFEEASKRGYATYFFHLTSTNQQEIIQKIRESKISGVIFHVACIDLLSAISQKINCLGIPFGTVNLGNDSGIGVTTDDFQGAIDVVGHLTKLGHQRIAHLTIKKNSEFVTNRRNGYLEGMKRFANGTSSRVIESTSNDYSDICKKLLTEPQEVRPTAVFCFMDNVAMVLMRYAIQLNVKIPQELSLVGFGNSFVTEYAAIPLTSVSQPFKRMGSLTVEKIIDTIENPNSTEKNVDLKLKTKLVVRASTDTCSQNLE